MLQTNEQKDQELETLRTALQVCARQEIACFSSDQSSEALSSTLQTTLGESVKQVADFEAKWQSALRLKESLEAKFADSKSEFTR